MSTSPTADASAAALAIAAFTLPWGGQEFQLQQVDFGAGGARLLRLRIREGKRFTVIDIDAFTARSIAAAIAAWSEAEIGRCAR